ncbi:hypothetical protein BCR44DRAFT_1502130 [Catenaria anguillulae PL171]|uniref:Homeobox domain-containing protein n=1 Tax=Catenaria anguillulae PL171 TaxID=765915 RepID=A0A1Y2HCJ4_9FUNG|nr:hypothetical protein BCR44DRAFT_1502130 [Catenaria anguillulae PL171]
MSYAHDPDHDLGHHDGSPSAAGDHASGTGTADDGDHDHTNGTATPPDHQHAAPSSLSYASSTDALNSQSHQSAASGAKRRLPPHIVAAFEAAWVAAGNNTPASDIVAQLAHAHGLELQKVRTWYNNRKAKEKRQRANQTIEVSSAGVTSVEGLAAATSALCTMGNRPRPSAGAASWTHMSPAVGAPMAIPSTLPPGPLVPGQQLTATPQPEHLLHTMGGTTFSIDHFPSEFSPDMFLAMRDRIIQLENYIMTLPTGGAGAPGAHAHPHHAGAHAMSNAGPGAAHGWSGRASRQRGGPPSGIVRQLKSKLEAKFLPESYAADVFEFVNAAPIRDLFGGADGGRLTVFSRARHDQVACELVKVVVLYDKESGRVFMQFGLRLAA